MVEKGMQQKYSVSDLQEKDNLLEICLEYIEASKILCETYQREYGSERLGEKKPLVYVLAHSYECFLKAARLHFKVVGKENSHSLIELSEGLVGKIDAGLIQYSVWLSNHHCIKGEGVEKNAYPDRYNDYNFNGKKVHELFNLVKKRQMEMGLEDIDALGSFDRRMQAKLDPEYTQLRLLVKNSIRIIPTDFTNCIETLSLGVQSLKERDDAQH